MLIGTLLDGAREAAIREHKAIAAAVRRRDAETARGLMREHLRRSFGEWEQAGFVDPGPERFVDVE
jgi:DNA-binding GntR family transcriptional regulator